MADDPLDPLDTLDATISRCEGDLQIAIGPVGDWFPDDAQLQKLREATTDMVKTMIKDSQAEKLLWTISDDLRNRKAKRKEEEI